MRSNLIQATPKQIEALKAAGFYVEDMGAEYGDEFKGQFRWMNDKSGDFQDHDVSFSESEAWAECVFYADMTAVQ